MTVHECPAHDEVARGGTREQTVKGVRLLCREIAEGHQVQQPVVEARDRAKVRLAQLGRLPYHGIEYRLHLGRRA